MSKVYPLQGNQMHAVAPERTVWLSASAGTGKTQVLSARVLRLLLQPGVEPEHLLCLTFTKAGAAEMATRVNDVLASWVRLPEIDLAGQLRAIGASIHPDTVARARSRFAAVLDCPGGGLRIETIHAFSQWLLSAFPVEAGLLPGTRAMEDRDRDLLVRQVLAELLVTAQDQGDETLLDALSDLSLRMAQDQVEDFLLRCAGARELWFGEGAWQPPLRPRINRALGLEAEEDSSGLAALCADDAFDSASVRRCMEANAAWGAKGGIEAANALGDWLAASPQGRLDTLDALAARFLTGKGEPRSARYVDKHEPAYADYQARVIACIEAVRERRALVALAERLAPALTLGRRFALAWDEAKAREGFIDFDDQIRAAAALLTERASAEWIRYKLDRRFDHILVDEAQDTNEAQWRIVLDGLVQDFFTGEGQHAERMRTLFVVGDYKQAIFRFQGTSPENFAAAKDRVARQLSGVAEVLGDERRELLGLGLGQSYRTANSILSFVDRAIHLIGPARFGLPEAPEPHRGEDRPGQIALWRPVGLPEGEAEAEDVEESGDEGGEGWLSRPDRDLADRLARQIRAWLENGFPLQKGEHRLAGPGDVMVLVRKRKELAGLIVARLHAQGVPVAGVDRLRLGAPLAVKDLVAALRFCAQPLDDLNLAALLVSPLVGWTQEDLLRHGYRDKGVRLWEHLRASEGPDTHPAMEALRGLLQRADYEPAHDLLHWLLVGPWQGRRKLVARLGREANDPIDELLNAAMAYAAANVPSLVGFLQWFDAGEGELKREAGKAENLVRVMTVHGSKGLQAPIVILADAADDPDASPPRGLAAVEEILGRKRTVPLPALRKEEKVGAVRTAELQVAKEEREEHWRLLYVAMTRAEEALFIGGSMSKRRKELPADSWYAQLEPLFGEDDWIDDPLWGGRKELGSLPARPAAKARREVAPALVLPEVLRVPVGPEPRPPRPLAPSSLGEDEAPDPPVRPGPGALLAARRGTLVHKLIERLPELPAEARGDAARTWLARAAADFAEDAREAMAEAALAVIGHPDWQDVFGPGSLAEVPVAALVGDRIVSGTIDRLLIGAERIRIVDFKTGRRPPSRIEDVPTAYVRQMAAYVAALSVIHPGKGVEAALLYTHAPRLFVLSDALIAAQKLDLPAAQ
ncbi:double-strand break repair helicase AddA [Novosphingobium sp. KCTC 2891]|uniref:double-strand break repair helicase AddA n=1 Tax=Novosphingobium sp. KCTC 2891 TaxID=2989730 RepID=UPI002223AF0A|nr:double-strand break repair helicase AddA [Novosphingobium sp. KCTC 2891]MCW1384832.1 double-strand break repair helicase AddA [Novosphingobium sp. KCTC 2891]